jgi:hypothetical protein
MTLDEWLAVKRGEDIDSYRKGKAFQQRLSQAAEQYRNAPVERWPNIKINWDIRPESQKFSFDGPSIKKFEENYPKGLCLGYVELVEFDKALCRFSRRDEGELWNVGFASKLAYLIVYLSEGNPISPPFVKPIDNREVILAGGNHRYAIAKAIGEKTIPIYVCPEHKPGVETRITVEWKLRVTCKTR